MSAVPLKYLTNTPADHEQYRPRPGEFVRGAQLRTRDGVDPMLTPEEKRHFSDLVYDAQTGVFNLVVPKERDEYNRALDEIINGKARLISRTEPKILSSTQIIVVLSWAKVYAEIPEHRYRNRR